MKPGRLSRRSATGRQDLAGRLGADSLFGAAQMFDAPQAPTDTDRRRAWIGMATGV